MACGLHIVFSELAPVMGHQAPRQSADDMKSNDSHVIWMPHHCNMHELCVSKIQGTDPLPAAAPPTDYEFKGIDNGLKAW